MRFHEAIHGVYFDDLDVFGILHNSRYLLLFERTIGSFWARLGWSSTTDWRHNPDAHHLVRANHVEYHRAVQSVGEVRVRVWVEKLGRTSLTFGFRLLPLDEDVDFATGHRVLVNVDFATRKPVPWSDAFREKIAPFVQEAVDGPSPHTQAGAKTP